VKIDEITAAGCRTVAFAAAQSSPLLAVTSIAELSKKRLKPKSLESLKKQKKTSKSLNLGFFVFFKYHLCAF